MSMKAAATDGEFVAPDLAGAAVMIVTAAEVEASLLMRRLGRWGARTCTATDARVAFALLPERHWDALLVDFPLAAAMIAEPAWAKLDVARRLVLIEPSARHELPALKAAGFTGYLVKPVRAASLAARWQAEDKFDAGPVAEDVRREAAAQRGLSILVAEDNEINALLARALLGRLGHLPTITGNGAAAVEAWRAARSAGRGYDLILMDMQMPEIDGLEATRRIRAAEIEAGEKPVPILALTANAAEDDRAACLNAGMDGILVKPLDRQRLSDAIVAAKLSAATLAA